MKLAKLCKKWQKRLGLQGWDISVQLIPVHAQDEDAHSDIDEFNLRAKISICGNRDPGSLTYRSDEFLLVHELLHVRFSPDGVKEDTREHLAQEQGINVLSKLLLELEAGL